MRRFYPFLLALALTGVSAVARAQQQQPAVPSASGSVNDQKPATANDKAPVPEELPVTVKPGEPDSKKKVVDNDPVMGVPPLPSGKTSMIGGTVTKLDGVRNRLGVKVFGANRWDLAFDERTHFYRDGKETTFENVHKGDRVYVDTMFDDHQILARNVRVVTKTGPANARGQVMQMYDGSMSVLDSLSGQPVRFAIDSQTQVKRDGRAATIADVQPGSLIAIRFAPDRPHLGIAREIILLASPGENVTFAGKVMHLDLSTGELSVANRTDNKTYDIAFDRDNQVPGNLVVGADVTIAAVFDGHQYKANSINVDKAAQ